jgi:outer membrane receptor protein involved in Fe transport
VVATLLAVLVTSSGFPAVGRDSASLAEATADSAAAAPRVVRSFPPVEVHALLHDLRSSQSVHLIPGTVLHRFPVDGLSDVLALQPGVVVQADELHVRGGRSGEAAVEWDGLSLTEPLRHRSMEAPLLSLAGAELVSGVPEAQNGGALAGVLQLRTLDPGERTSVEWRWQTDGRLGTHYDRLGARLDTPLHVLGLGAVTAADVTLDDTYLPNLRTPHRRKVAGLSFGWRAENRLLGSFKLAPVRQPDRFSAQLLMSKQIHEPYSPNWSLDGWTYLDPNPKVSPTFSPVPQPGSMRYRAADHLGITNDRQLAALVKASRSRTNQRASLSLGWLRTRTVTSVSGGYEPEDIAHRPLYGYGDRDRFYVLWGDDPLYRESGSDVVTLRGDGEIAMKGGSRLSAGAGLQHEHVSLREMDWMPISRYGPDFGPPPLDSIRTFSASAPGGFAYVQDRWQTGGMVLNTGLRVEYFTPGSQASRQTLPGSARGVWSFGPRLGIAYPISVHDVFSLCYVRMQQAPGRDYLYDRRQAISNRQPLGNPELRPATLISYEGVVKHVFGPAWALQASVFYRDVFGQIGARDYSIPDGPLDLRYVDQDESNAAGFEWSVIHAGGDQRRLEVHYTWMQAWGNESRPEGDPYGPIRQARIPAISDQPLPWDRRHSLLVGAVWQWTGGWSLAWSTAVGSPLPWTPKPRRQSFTDISSINTRRLEWSESSRLDLQWSPRRAHGLTVGFEARNVFDTRGERVATLDGYPNPLVNTIYDDYGAYRTETGLAGGAYWSQLPPGDPGHWVPVHDPRLHNPPRAFRMSIGGRW